MDWKIDKDGNIVPLEMITGHLDPHVSLSSGQKQADDAERRKLRNEMKRVMTDDLNYKLETRVQAAIAYSLLSMLDE